MPKFPKGPRVRVNVTKEVITRAVAADSSKCWIAEAIKAQVPNAVNVAVDLSTIRFTDPERELRYVYLTPYSAQLALIQFDEGNPPPSFAFVLKNAHVTRAGSLPRRPDLRAKAKQTRAEKQKEKRADARRALLARTTIVRGDSKGNVPRRVGGRRPPQLKMLRQFGIRAFRGASKARLDADAALVARAEAGET
jgi:hypothetical protein